MWAAATFARPTRRSVPTWASTWSRYSSTSKPHSTASPSNVVENKVNETVQLKPVDPLLSALQQEDGFVYPDLEKELSGITAADLEPGLKEPPKIANSESELFGTTLATPSLDPSALPLRLPLNPSTGSFTETQYAASLVHGRAMHLPFFHPRTHSIPAAMIHFRSHEIRQLDFFTHFATHAACALAIPVSRPFMLPTKRTLWTVLRSPFAHKKSQENFERRVHKRGIKAWDADSEVIERWLRYLRKHAMGGVGMRVVRWERMPLGIGASHLEEVDAFLEGATSVTERSDKIKTMGEQIIKTELGGHDRQVVTKSSKS